MKKSINLYFNNEISSQEKIKTIKEIGYDEFFTGIYDAKETLSWQNQIEFASSMGLRCTMMHCLYYEPNLNDFWEENEIGEKVCQDYINQIEKCRDLCDNFVVHLNGAKYSKQTEIGLSRIRKILKVCEKYNINLCIENLYSEKEIPYIFDNISHKNLKICYDTGHKHYQMPNFDICQKYGKYISVLHIHQNNGKTDQHKCLTKNSKVFYRLIKELPFLDKNIVLSGEIKIQKQNWKTQLKQNLNAFCVLE